MSKLRVSAAAHVIMPYHVALDGAREAAAGDGMIGTTKRGIGPAYGDRAWRTGIRMGDLLDPDLLRVRLIAALAEKNALLERAYGLPGFEFESLFSDALSWGQRLAPLITDTTAIVQAALERDELVLLRAPRAPCSISTTARTRTSPLRTRWRAELAPEAESAHAKSPR